MTKTNTNQPPQTLSEAIARAEIVLTQLSPSEAETFSALIQAMKNRLPPQLPT